MSSTRGPANRNRAIGLVATNSRSPGPGRSGADVYFRMCDAVLVRRVKRPEWPPQLAISRLNQVDRLKTGEDPAVSRYRARFP